MYSRVSILTLVTSRDYRQAYGYIVIPIYSQITLFNNTTTLKKQLKK